jgi:TolA-binding protein
MNSKGLIAGIILIIAGIASFALYEKIVKPELEARSVVAEAKLILEKGDRDSYNQAINALRKVLVSYPDTKYTAEAYLLTGQAYEKLGLYRQAYLKYCYLFKKPLSEQTPSRIRQQALVGMNKIRIMRNYTEEGIHNLYSMLSTSQNPDLRSRVYSELGQAYLKNNDPKKALSSFDIALQENNSNEEAIIGKARSLKRSGQNDQAFILYDYFLKYYGSVSPYAGDIRATYRNELYAAGLGAFRSGNYRGAAYYFANFINRFPGDKLVENALYWTGESYFAVKQFDTANAYFDKVLSNNWYHKDEDARIKKGYAYFISKRYDLAAKEFQLYLKNYPRGKHVEEANRWKDMSKSEIKARLEKFKAPETNDTEEIREEEKAVEPVPQKNNDDEVKENKADRSEKAEKTEKQDSGEEKADKPESGKSSDGIDDDGKSNPFSNEEVSGGKEIELDNIADM